MQGKAAHGFAIGLVSGCFGGLMGLGGGVLMVPLMVHFLGLTQHRAHGTSLAALILTGFFGALAYWMDGSVDVTAALFLAASAIFTARAGAHYAHNLPAWKLKKYFGIFTLFVAALLIAKPYLPSPGVQAAFWWKAAALLATGAFTGFLSGMMGVGGGSMMVPAMVLLAGMGQHTAQGSSLLAMVPAGIAGARTHWKLGNVAAEYLPGLLGGIVIGSFAGGKLAGILPDNALRIMFAAVLVYTGATYSRSQPPPA
ncbi:MAG: sulfite exporter TauE/SafE family protein [Nitrospinae bacterium]|nr:sulfite exporter TauE/SafE family protein [Nitrospinota bacterium]